MKGEKLVLNAVAGIEETANEVKGVGQTIERLNEKVGDILNIVDVIGAVADQTNLLALNAAIEAARAGEQGRGFAVVADEVRALAKRTQDNTQEISKVVEGLTTSSNEAFTAIAKGVAKADAAVTYSKEIQIALKDVSDKMTELRSFSDAVEQSAHQQSFSLKQITEGVRSIDLFGAENAVGAEQVSAASQQLSATSSSMLAKIQKYTT
jgi:methyl-accepting chemotaxis protein